MLLQNINKMIALTKQLQEYVEQDIVDVKSANHNSLFERNAIKTIKMDELLTAKKAISSQLSDSDELYAYVDILNDLEKELQQLYTLNDSLASIVLPVNEIYKEILDDISNEQGNLVEVNA